MKKQKGDDGFSPFVIPILILVFGILLVYINIPLFTLSTHEVTSAGIAAFALGSFTFIILINHGKNDVTTDGELISLSNVLTIYAGILTMLVYERIFAVETIILTIFMMLILGTGVAILADWANLGRFDVPK